MGASLHDVLTRLKAQPHIYHAIDISYSPSEPLTHPVILDLPQNGLRLRFDGPDQRLRLIEVLDFTKTLLTYDKIDLVKLPEKASPIADHVPAIHTGPAFRHVYDRMFGPTFPGEYVPSPPTSTTSDGLYVLSYPGIAFNFPLRDSERFPDRDKDFVSLLSDHAAAATSMALFEGQSWQKARQDLMTRPCTNPRSLALSGRGKELRPAEIEMVIVRGNGRLDLERRNSPTFQIELNRTTPQDLVAELGPPDAIHRKFDRRLSIHKTHNQHRNTSRAFPNNFSTNNEDTTDTDHSSTQSITEESDQDDEDLQMVGNTNIDSPAECFYNYFHHGFDIFISNPTFQPSSIPHVNKLVNDQVNVGSANQLVVTKMLLHANVPGSYPFNRYRRSRWAIHLQDFANDAALNSETLFTKLSASLQRVWRDDFARRTSEDSVKNAMVLNRDWGDSPGSSCEFLGNWEESSQTQEKGFHKSEISGGPGFGNTKLYGFPELLFEVLKNDVISCLTVY